MAFRRLVLHHAPMADRALAPSSSLRELPMLPKGWQPLTYAVLADGALAVVGTDVDLAGEHQRIRAALRRNPGQRLDPPSRIRELGASGAARIWTVSGEGWKEESAFPLETPFPLVDRFQDGRWLVVGARAEPTPNARVLARDGSVLGRFMLGDGIEHVAIDHADRIWVGWFDEGVFGNEGWRVEGHQWPPSNNGVACFAQDGVLLALPEWGPNALIADCYALNAIGDGAWCYAYTEFGLAHCVPGEPVRWWRNEVVGAKAIAIDGSLALIAGGYGVEGDKLTLVALHGAGHGEEAPEVASWSLPLRPRTQANEWEPAWEHPDLLLGRGDLIHMVDRNAWHTWRVADLVQSIRF